MSELILQVPRFYSKYYLVIKIILVNCTFVNFASFKGSAPQIISFWNAPQFDIHC